MPLGFWARWNAELRKAAPGVLLLGELLDGDASKVAETWSEGGFNAMFDFPLAFAIGDVFCRDESPVKLGAVLTNDRRYPDPSRLVTLVDNHDLPRVMSACGNEEERVRAALAFLLTARGIPSLAWGTEVGLDGAKEPDNRKSMAFTHHALKDEVAFWLKARAEHPALSEGAVAVVGADANGLSILRVSDSQVAVVLVGQAGRWPPVKASLLELSTLREVLPPAGRARGVKVLVSAIAAGRFRALRESVEPQWRRGASKVQVRFDGPAGTLLVGSGPELGDWNSERAVPLPADVALPTSGVFEFKAIRREAGKVVWASGPNGQLLVERATRVALEPVFGR